MAKTITTAKELCEQLKIDPELRRSYSATISLSFSDECHNYKKKHKKATLSQADIRKCANVAADNFLKLLCDVTQWPVKSK